MWFEMWYVHGIDPPAAEVGVVAPDWVALLPTTMRVCLIFRLHAVTVFSHSFGKVPTSCRVVFVIVEPQKMFVLRPPTSSHNIPIQMHNTSWSQDCVHWETLFQWLSVGTAFLSQPTVHFYSLQWCCYSVREMGRLLSFRASFEYFESPCPLT